MNGFVNTIRKFSVSTKQCDLCTFCAFNGHLFIAHEKPLCMSNQCVNGKNHLAVNFIPSPLVALTHLVSDGACSLN